MWAHQKCLDKCQKIPLKQNPKRSQPPPQVKDVFLWPFSTLFSPPNALEVTEWLYWCDPEWLTQSEYTYWRLYWHDSGEWWPRPDDPDAPDAPDDPDDSDEPDDPDNPDT